MPAAGYREGNSVLFTLALLLMLEVCSVGSCRSGSGAECVNAPFVPGYNLAGEGFDVVRMHRTGAYVINIKGHLADNQTCTLCSNRFHEGQDQKLPAEMLDWRPFNRYSKQLSSALHHSVDSLLRSGNSLVNNNWDLGLGLDNKAVLGGSRSDLAKFAQSQHSADKTTFALHEISCTFYSYRVADHPELSAQFTKHLRRLPQSINSSQERALYRRLIDIYGTHYIHQVQLGGRVRQITAFRTCLATLKGFSEMEIKDCLNFELRMSLGFVPANASLSKKCDNLLKHNPDMGFYQGIMNQKIEVTGGQKYFPDILHQQERSNTYDSWITSLHDHPDVVSYAILPLHLLVEDRQMSDNLKSSIKEYIQENQLREDQHGLKKCSPTPNLDHNCCPLQTGRGSLTLVIQRAVGLWADAFSQADAYIKISYEDKYMETRTIVNNDNPKWDVTCGLGSVVLGRQLTLEVWDIDVFSDHILGKCVVFPQRGFHSHSCRLSTGILHFTYTVKCDDHLTGPRCGIYSPRE